MANLKWMERNDVVEMLEQPGVMYCRCILLIKQTCWGTWMFQVAWHLLSAHVFWQNIEVFHTLYGCDCQDSGTPWPRSSMSLRRRNSNPSSFASCGRFATFSTTVTWWAEMRLSTQRVKRIRKFSCMINKSWKRK